MKLRLIPENTKDFTREINSHKIRKTTLNRRWEHGTRTQQKSLSERVEDARRSMLAKFTYCQSSTEKRVDTRRINNRRKIVSFVTDKQGQTELQKCEPSDASERVYGSYGKEATLTQKYNDTHSQHIGHRRAHSYARCDSCGIRCRFGIGIVRSFAC